MDAYLNLPKRPTWLPLFETQASILEHERKHRQIIDDHVTALREDHKAGRFVLVDKEHRVVTAVQMGAHLSRKDAIAYLERHLLTYVDEIEAQDITGDEKMVAIAKFHAELKAKRDPSPTKNTAIAFNVDESYVRRANRKAKAVKEQKPVKKRTFKDGKEVLLR